MHWIEKYILKELIFRGHARFADLKPARVESNLFLYHLKNLIREKYVEKTDDGYKLSSDGLRFASFYSYDQDSIRLQPKIIKAVVCYDGEKVLVHRRGREPFKGKISLVNGKLHFGEPSILESARRELKEKTGLTATDINHVGDTYLHYNLNGDNYNHVLSHNFTCTKWEGELRDTIQSELLWKNIDELRSDPDVLPGTVEILDLIATGKWFFKELTSEFVA